jgi:prolyl 4-hydroxylase
MKHLPQPISPWARRPRKLWAMAVQDDLQALQARAQAGEAAALHALGVRQLSADGAPHAPGPGVGAILAAAEMDYPPALLAAAVFAVMGVKAPPDWKRAVALVARAASLGDASAQRQFELIGGDDFDFARATAIPQGRKLSESPRVFACDDFISGEWCDWLMERARPRLAPATVYAPEGLRTADGRSNSDSILRPEASDLVSELVNARIARAVGLPLANQEHTHVLHYEAGQEFKPHFDFIDTRSDYGARNVEAFGQRVATMLIYLNDGYDGGETLFLRPNLRFKGKKGAALMFFNVQPDGAPDVNTRHAGLAPTRGEKWLLSKWVRSKPHPLL